MMKPVYSSYMADPFVLSHAGMFYAYGTGPSSDASQQFPVLQSHNLVDWVACGWALEPVDGAVEYWAPEVAYHDGVFYLYYSARGINNCDHQLRVATSTQPTGPFRDTGRVLTPNEPFTIDAHPFRDRDGQWYLFYSCDFLMINDNYRVGTGIVVDRLVNMVTLAGQPQVVVRPHADWQLFEAQRSIYGGVYDWHTIEGAAMRLHNGRYYCFYSGGAWMRDTYGVSYVVAEHPIGPYRLPDIDDARVLKTVPRVLIGPGHNSFTEDASGSEYIIYHAWDKAMTARLMHISRLVWQGDVPTIAHLAQVDVEALASIGKVNR
jgi:GH43 family beta-xylosidase